MNRTSRWCLVAAPVVVLFCMETWQPSVCGQATVAARARRNKPAATAKATPPPLAAPIPAPAAEAAELSPPVDKGTNPPVVDSGVSETEIIAMGGGDGTESANFSSKDRVAVFYGQVRVTDPRFQLACDKLTVYLRKSKTDKTTTDASGASPTPTPAPLAAKNGKGNNSGPDLLSVGDSSNGGIDYAIAEGHVVMVQEKPPDTPGGEPKRSTAKSEWGKFDNNTGVMTLKGLPSVQQNGNLHVALSRETVMFLSKEGGLKTNGPSRTLIVQRKDTPLGGPTATQPKG